MKDMVASDVQEVAPIKSPESLHEECWIGFPSALVEADRNETFMISLAMAFRPLRIIIPHHVGVCFNVVSFRVGAVDQFRFLPGTVEVPAVLFGEDTLSVIYYFDTAAPGLSISITVHNTTDSPATFFAQMLGQRMK